MTDLKPVIDTTSESQASFVKFGHFENLNETINFMSPIPKTQDTLNGHLTHIPMIHMGIKHTHKLFLQYIFRNSVKIMICTVIETRSVWEYDHIYDFCS